MICPAAIRGARASGTWGLRLGHLGLAPEALRFRPVWGLGWDVWIVGHLGLAPGFTISPRSGL